MVGFGQKQEGWTQGKHMQLELDERNTHLFIPFNKLHHAFKITVYFIVFLSILDQKCCLDVHF